MWLDSGLALSARPGMTPKAFLAVCSTAAFSRLALRPHPDRKHCDQAKSRHGEENQPRTALVHDRSENQRSNDAADIETRGHETEHFAERAGPRDLADDHVA